MQGTLPFRMSIGKSRISLEDLAERLLYGRIGYFRFWPVLKYGLSKPTVADACVVDLHTEKRGNLGSMDAIGAIHGLTQRFQVIDVLPEVAGGQAADAHLATAHIAQAIAKAGPILAQPPVIHRFTQLA